MPTASGGPGSAPRGRAVCATLLGLCLAAGTPSVASGADAWSLGGDLRYYQFLRLDDRGPDRRDTELGLGRLKLGARPTDSVAAEAHGLLELTSPAAPATTSIATGTTRRFLDLGHTFRSGDDVEIRLEMDRLNLQVNRPEFRAVVGRQAVTWGVNFFWPVLDLFAPFPPQRVDRDYKPGVDALRLTVPLGRLSEVDVVAAGQGTDLERDGTAGALVRVHLGPADVGIMGGWFHRDVVAGAFVTASIRGTGLRGEVAFTESGDPDDARIDRERFVRASVGVDRQITSTLFVTAEVAWNGFGAADPDDYPLIAAADRTRRGEVTSLGRLHAGTALRWQVHPLVLLVGTALVNLDDGSFLFQPEVDWSVSDNVTLVGGASVGAGRDAHDDGRPRSEYGGLPRFVYAAVKFAF